MVVHGILRRTCSEGVVREENFEQLHTKGVAVVWFPLKGKGEARKVLGPGQWHRPEDCPLLPKNRNRAHIILDPLHHPIRADVASEE